MKTDAEGKGGSPGKAKGGFDVKKAGKKPIDAKGMPKMQETGIPGAPNMGTPSWIKASSNHAEGLAKSRNFGTGHESGTGGIRSGLFPRKEKIHGGQATRVGKDSD